MSQPSLRGSTPHLQQQLLLAEDDLDKQHDHIPDPSTQMPGVPDGVDNLAFSTEISIDEPEIFTPRPGHSTQRPKISLPKQEISMQHPESSTQQLKISTQQKEISIQQPETSTQQLEISSQQREISTLKAEVSTQPEVSICEPEISPVNEGTEDDEENSRDLSVSHASYLNGVEEDQMDRMSVLSGVGSMSLSPSMMSQNGGRRQTLSVPSSYGE